MSLTPSAWVKLIIVAALAVCGDYFIREWYQPYVQYVTGSSYIHPKLSIANIGLKNWGHSDAENVTITASFADPLMSISTDQMATPFDPSNGGIGQKFVTGTIKRLVPGEIVNIYFTMEPSSPWADQKPTIRVIKFNGGMGKTGVPILTFWVIPLLAIVVLFAVIDVGLKYFGRRDRQFIHDHMREAIHLGVSARQEGISAEQLDTRVENFRRTLPFFRRPSKDTLITCAQAAFTGKKQNPE